MFSVLLVDDETEVRSGLRLKMNWASLGFAVEGEAKDGREALGLLEAKRYDLVMTDIRMPVMGGLELLKQCAENYPDVQLVVLSGYDDFDYVKAAMQSGARDYLLKPVVRSELAEVLRRLREQLEEERRERLERETMRHRLKANESLQREQWLQEWMERGEASAAALQEDAIRLGLASLAEPGVLRVIGIELRVPEGRLGDGERGMGAFRAAFELLCRETAAEDKWQNRVLAFRHTGHPAMMLVLVSEGEGTEAARLPTEFCGEVIRRVRSVLRAEAVAAVSGRVQGARELGNAYASMLAAWSRSEAGPISRVVMADEPGEEAAEFDTDLDKRMELALEQGDAEAFIRVICTIMQGGTAYPVQSAVALTLRALLVLDRIARRHGRSLPEAQRWLMPAGRWLALPAPEAAAGLRRLAEQAAAAVRASRSTDGAGIAETVRRRIEADYMLDLSLAEMAQQYHINPTYLSEVFKKQTGRTFSDYVTHVRLTRAAELLGDSGLRLSDIAELVGFGSASYLSSAFKKRYGVSPNDYRAQADAGPAKPAARSPEHFA